MKSRMDIKWAGTPIKRDNYWYDKARAAAERARPYSINTLVALMASDKWCVRAKDMDEFCNDVRREYPEMLEEKTHKHVLDAIVDAIVDDVVEPTTVENLEIYGVEFSLGPDPNNVAYKFRMVGVPTDSKVSEHLSHWVDKMRMQIWFNTGLPSPRCLMFSQCLWLLNRYGLPETGLAKQCVCGKEDGYAPFVIGHISTNKVDTVYKIETGDSE